MTGESENLSLAEALKKARQGDADQRDRLFDVCRSYLGVVARAQVETWMRAKIDPSDIVQQTLMEAHRDFDRFQGQTGNEWLAWLRRILTNNAADFVRKYHGTAKRQARREVPIAHPADASDVRGTPEPAAGDASPSQQVILADDQLRLAAAVSQLSPDHQEVIVLRNLERLPFDEVALRMDRSRPAVQMLWMRAVKKLQEVMGE